MFNAKTLVLPPKLEWKLKDEPALAEWSLRARAYNTDVANGLFLIFLLITAVATGWLGLKIASDYGDKWGLLWFCVLFLILLSAALSMTHQTTKFAYRLTASGLEVCEWKEFPEWLPRLLKWAAGITAVVMLIIATVHPAALIGAIAGPGLMGLMYVQMGTSSQFRRMHEQFHHIVHSWGDFKKITVFRRRAIIGLHFESLNPNSDGGKGRMIPWEELLYCRKSQLDDLITLVRQQLPDSIPYEEAYIPIYV